MMSHICKAQIRGLRPEPVLPLQHEGMPSAVECGASAAFVCAAQRPRVVLLSLRAVTLTYRLFRFQVCLPSSDAVSMTENEHVNVAQAKSSPLAYQVRLLRYIGCSVNP